MSPHQINCHSIYQLALAETYHLFGELFGFFFHFLHTVCAPLVSTLAHAIRAMANRVNINLLHTLLKIL